MPVLIKPFRQSRFPVSFDAGKILLLLILIIYPALNIYASSNGYLFSKITGEADPQIRSIIQLPDGRMAFATVSGIDIFDGTKFSHLYSVTGENYNLTGYDGFHHLYVTHSGKYLWIKNRYQLQCVDLSTEIYSTDVGSTLRNCGVNVEALDLFADSSGRLWVVSADGLLQPDTDLSIPLDKVKGDLLDLVTADDNLYLFYRSGDVSCIDLKSGKILYSLAAYPAEEQPKYSFTSHVVEADHKFYQIRNGGVGGFFMFDPASQKWSKILESNLRLNTLAVTDSDIFISTTDGLLSINPATFAVSHLQHIRTQSGNILASELSSIAVDKSGGIWVGTLNRGIFFYNPYLYNHFIILKDNGNKEPIHQTISAFSEGHDGTIRINRNGKSSRLLFPEDPDEEIIIEESDNASTKYAGEYGSGATFISNNGGVFFSEPDSYSIFIPKDSISINHTSKPFLSGILINANRIEPLKEYGGDVVLQKILAQTSGISLAHNQNFITFEVTDPDYTCPDPKFYFMLEGIDPQWREATSADVKDRMLTTTYTAIPPGEYTFRVRLSNLPDFPESSLKITIRHPWWSTPWAKTIYAISLILAVIIIVKLYIRRTKKHMEAEQRETYLISRIRQLIEEVDRYKSESPVSDHQPESKEKDSSSELSEEDKAFIARAMELVEQNLDSPGYSVAQLSSDLCMDRTGLYRKLTSLLDRSPSLFIRDIRLRKAAALLKEGAMSITEIAEKTGFSSTSYMSKCFQERYGCKPSQFQHNCP